MSALGGGEHGSLPSTAELHDLKLSSGTLGSRHRGSSVTYVLVSSLALGARKRCALQASLSATCFFEAFFPPLAATPSRPPPPSFRRRARVASPQIQAEYAGRPWPSTQAVMAIRCRDNFRNRLPWIEVRSEARERSSRSRHVPLLIGEANGYGGPFQPLLHIASACRHTPWAPREMGGDAPGFGRIELWQSIFVIDLLSS